MGYLYKDEHGVWRNRKTGNVVPTMDTIGLSKELKGQIDAWTLDSRGMHLREAVKMTDDEFAAYRSVCDALRDLIDWGPAGEIGA